MLIAITGASGFLGRATCRALLGAGHRINAIARKPVERPGMIAFGCGNSDLALAVADADVILHLATSYGRPGEPINAVLDANVVLPTLLAEHAAKRGIPLLLADSFFAKSGMAYDYLPVYTASKRAVLLMVAGVMGTRAALGQLVIEHMYGPGDDPRRAIPHLVSQIIHGAGRLALTSGHQRRDFIHVDDAARAVATAVTHATSWSKGITKQLGIGTGQATSLRDFLELAHRLAGSRVELGWGDLPTRVGEPVSDGADTAWLVGHGWKPQFKYEVGVLDLVQWHRNQIPKLAS